MTKDVALCRLIKDGIKDEKEAQKFWRDLSRSLPGDSEIKSIISRYIAEEELHENWLRKELEDCIAVARVVPKKKLPWLEPKITQEYIDMVYKRRREMYPYESEQVSRMLAKRGDELPF